MAVCQNLVPLVNIKIAGKWMFVPLKMVLIGIDPSPNKARPLLNQLSAWPPMCRFQLQLFLPVFASSCAVLNSL